MKFAPFRFVSHRENRRGCKRFCTGKGAFRFGACEVKEE